MERDLLYGLDQIKKHLILLQDHLTSGSCPSCVKDKHLPAIQAYAEEALPMAKDKRLRRFLISLRDWAISFRRKLGDVL